MILICFAIRCGVKTVCIVEVNGFQAVFEQFLDCSFEGLLFTSDNWMIAKLFECLDQSGMVQCLSGAIGPNQGDILTHQLEKRLGFFEDSLLTTDHNGQRGGLGADLTAGDRGVEIVTACLRDLLRKT
jgi:hypothetical protein